LLLFSVNFCQIEKAREREKEHLLLFSVNFCQIEKAREREKEKERKGKRLRHGSEYIAQLTKRQVIFVPSCVGFVVLRVLLSVSVFLLFTALGTPQSAGRSIGATIPAKSTPLSASRSIGATPPGTASVFERDRSREREREER